HRFAVLTLRSLAEEGALGVGEQLDLFALDVELVDQHALGLGLRLGQAERCDRGRRNRGAAELEESTPRKVHRVSLQRCATGESQRNRRRGAKPTPRTSGWRPSPPLRTA